jgi:competence protein ComEA
MLKKLLMLCAVLLSLSSAFANAVEVNTADETALESVKGIGPVHAKAIIDERTKNGPFKDADDLAARVKGLGTKSVTNLETAGLTVNGSSTPPTGRKGASANANKAASMKAPSPTAQAQSAPATGASGGAAPNMMMMAASGTRATKANKKANDAAGTSPPAATPASAASSAKASKKKGKKSKAASAVAASGG